MKKIIFTLIVLAAAASGIVLLTQTARSENAASKEKTLYTCGMHPQVIQDHPGNCPICGMKLTPIRKLAGDSQPGERKIKFYKSTMNPGETSPTPAKDSMGMDMVPVYEDVGGAANSSAIAIDPVTIQNMNLRTMEITRGPLRKTIRTIGTIDYNETALADVTTKFKGWIEKLYVDATGQLVHRGEPLFEIYSPELYSAQVEYLLALNQSSTNDPGAAMLRETASNKLKFYDISEAQIAEIEKSREPRKTLQVVAPMDGFATEKMVVQGQMVDAGMKLYRLADLGIVWVFAQIYEQDLPYVQLGQEAVVKLSSMPDREFRGRVTYVYPNVDEKTRTARVRMEFENPGYFLKPGMFVSVHLTAEVEPSVLLVPDSAVLRSGAKNTVFVALDGGRFDARTVVLGAEAEDAMYQVISGLNEGERVVTSGQFMLDSESQLNEAIAKMRGPANATRTSATSTLSTNVAEQATPTKTSLESVVYVCPMPEHVSIIYDHAGNCPICKMALVPVTPSSLKKLQPGGKVLYYTCPMPEHASVHEEKPGKCPLCAMTLIPVMASPTIPAQSKAEDSPAAKRLYTCPMHPEVISDKPGKCPICAMTLIPVMAPPTIPAQPKTETPSATKPKAKQLYTCPMHPDVISETPGKCPKCEMDLLPKTEGGN
jgi:RND family efflux transporter MFP subunit